MSLKRLTDRIYIFPFEEDRDRPNLGYIRGDNFSVAVDAGHSAAHVREFYESLEAEDLPLPSLTVITHWHWDHAFGMHAVNGLTMAGTATDRHIRDFRDMVDDMGPDIFYSLAPAIPKEYPNRTPVIIVPADIVITSEVTVDAGNCPIRIFPAVSPHTDDSVLIEATGEKVLFLGDSACREFGTGLRDPELLQQLINTVKQSDCLLCVEGHALAETKTACIADMVSSLGED